MRSINFRSFFLVKLIDLQFAQFSGRRVEHTGDEELAEFFAISDGQLGVVSQWVIFRVSFGSTICMSAQLVAWIGCGRLTMWRSQNW